MSRVNGITDKVKLIHYFGHCNNNIQNIWCNDIAKVFGMPICEAMVDELPEFSPHLQITSEPSNVHR